MSAAKSGDGGADCSIAPAFRYAQCGLRTRCVRWPQEYHEEHDRPYGPSEDPHGRSFDFHPQHGVKAIPRCYVDGQLELVLKKLLDAYQIKSVESTARIVVDEEVKVAGRRRVVMDRRAKYVE